MVDSLSLGYGYDTAIMYRYKKFQSNKKEREAEASPYAALLTARIHALLESKVAFEQVLLEP